MTVGKANRSSRFGAHDANVKVYNAPVAVEIERRLDELRVIVHAVADVSDPVPVDNIAGAVQRGRVCEGNYRREARTSG